MFGAAASAGLWAACGCCALVYQMKQGQGNECMGFNHMILITYEPSAVVDGVSALASASASASPSPPPSQILTPLSAITISSSGSITVPISRAMTITLRGRFRTARAQRGHGVGIAPIITLFIPGTPLKTTHLQKHASPIQNSIRGEEFRTLGPVASIRLRKKIPGVPAGAVGCRIQDPGTRGYWWWKTAGCSHSARTARGVPLPNPSYNIMPSTSHNSMPNPKRLRLTCLNNTYTLLIGNAVYGWKAHAG